MFRIPVVITLLIITACTSRQEESEHSFQISEENGVVIAETKGGPKYAEDLFHYEEVLRLNQDESIIESLLTQPRTVLMDDEGAFYIEDGRVNRIVRFDASGNYTNDIGRQGEGPGEYQFPRLACIQHGLIVVTDEMLSRISWFKTDGTLEDSARMPRPSGMVIQRFRMGPHDERILLGDYQRGFRNEYRYNTAVAFVFSDDGASLASVISDSVAVMYFFRVEEFRASGSVSVYFSAYPRVLYHPAHGLVMTTGQEPEFQCFDLDGQLQREIRLDIPPEPVTSADKEAVRSYLRSRIQEAATERSRATRQKQLELAEFQDPKGYFSISRIDASGYIWATRPDPPTVSSASTGIRSVTFLVFSPEGEYLGNTELHMRRSHFLRDHRIANIEEDEETGAYNIIVYRIRTAIEGLKYP